MQIALEGGLRARFRYALECARQGVEYESLEFGYGYPQQTSLSEV